LGKKLTVIPLIPVFTPCPRPETLCPFFSFFFLPYPRPTAAARSKESDTKYEYKDVKMSAAAQAVKFAAKAKAAAAADARKEMEEAREALKKQLAAQGSLHAMSKVRSVDISFPSSLSVFIVVQ
jgi:hypothetical protein